VFLRVPINCLIAALDSIFIFFLWEILGKKLSFDCLFRDQFLIRLFFFVLHFSAAKELQG
jgi:hypothetical protein